VSRATTGHVSYSPSNYTRQRASSAGRLRSAASTNSLLSDKVCIHSLFGPNVLSKWNCLCFQHNERPDDVFHDLYDSRHYYSERKNRSREATAQAIDAVCPGIPTLAAPKTHALAAKRRVSRDTNMDLHPEYTKAIFKFDSTVAAPVFTPRFGAAGGAGSSGGKPRSFSESNYNLTALASNDSSTVNSPRLDTGRSSLGNYNAASDLLDDANIYYASTGAGLEDLPNDFEDLDHYYQHSNSDSDKQQLSSSNDNDTNRNSNLNRKDSYTKTPESNAYSNSNSGVTVSPRGPTGRSQSMVAQRGSVVSSSKLQQQQGGGSSSSSNSRR
jgi:hypothetical protein